MRIEIKMIVEIIVIIIIVLLFLYFNREQGDYEMVKSNTDGEFYKVVGNFQNRQEAADLIGRINLTNIKLLGKLKSKY